MSISTDDFPVSKLLAGTLMLQISALWHDGIKNYSGPIETRILQRAAGDAFLHHYFTSYSFGTNVFGHRPKFGDGLYNLIRNHSAALMKTFFPSAGIAKVKDFPKSKF